MDSEGNFPYDPSDHCYANNGICDTLGGNGISPDYWFYLGGCDYGRFDSSGADWSTLSPPSGGKSIMLDITNLLVQQSGGITQVIAINQTEVKPIRVSAYVSAENCTGNPIINVGFIGYPPGWPAVGGGNLTFDEGTYDFTFKKKTFIPSRPVKYLFFHILHRGFSVGKAWYGGFTLEELDIPQVSLPIENVIMNSNFFYSSDDIIPTGWDCVNSTIIEEINPIGTNSMFMQNNSSISQNNICIDKGLLKQKITIYSMSLGVTNFQVNIKLLDRYRNIINEKIINIETSNQWQTDIIYIMNTLYSEKVDIEITNISGDNGYIGGVLLVSEPLLSSNTININSNKNILEIPSNNIDSTNVINLDNIININHVELDIKDNNSVSFITDGLIGEFIASNTFKSFTLLQNSEMTKINDTEYTISPWNNNISEIEVNNINTDQYLRIPHIVHPDRWLVTTGGNIPANNTRYYCVTACTSFGETDRSNEVRAITDAISNTNCVPIEICPVDGATSYKIYMTQNEDTIQPWEYSVAGVKKLIWNDGQNHLVAEISAEQLRNNGYIYYDTGTNLLSGYPSITNTAKLWNIDNVNHKIIFDNGSIPVENVNAIYSVDEDINSILYLSHANKYYITTDSGIYESDIFVPNKLNLIESEINIVALSYFNDELWYMNNIGDVYNLSNTITYSGNIGFTDFCFINDNHIARISNSGIVKIFNLIGNITNNFNIKGSFDCKGLSLYYDKLITYDNNQNKFIVFDLSGNIIQYIDIPIIGITSWNIIGINLVVATDFTIAVYRIYANNYYAKLDKEYYLGNNPQKPTINRIQLPGEIIEPEYPELLANGTFEDGTTFPSGFNIYGDSIVDSGFSNEVAIDGTRSMYFNFPKASWKSINKSNVPIIGGRQYNFSIYTKSTANSNGLLGIQFNTSDGSGDEEFYTIPYTITYNLNQIILQAPIDAIEVDFRYLVYGSDSQGITYFMNALSLKEEDSPIQTFEHLYNGNYSIYPVNSTIPSGWEVYGSSVGVNATVTNIENPIIQSSGKAFKITPPIYDDITDNWVIVQSQKFDVNVGDNLEVGFYFKRENIISSNLQISLHYYDANDNQDLTVYKYITVSNIGNQYKILFEPNTTGYIKAKLRFWVFQGEYNWIENCSIIPIVTINNISNNDFSLQLSGWSNYGTNMSDEDVTGLGISIDSNIYHSTPLSCKFNIDRIDCRYTQIEQTVTLNQITPKKVIFNAWAKGENCINGANLWFETWIKYTDDTSEWNPLGTAQIWPSDTFDWTQLNFEFIPTKTIKEIDIIIDIGRGGTGIIWVDDIIVIEEQDIPIVDDVELTIPYTELNTETIKQIKLYSQLKYNGNNVEQKNLTVNYSISPNIGSIISLPTNSIGLSNAIYTLPSISSEITINASYEGITDSKTLTIYPLVLDNLQEPIIENNLPTNINNLYAEVIVPKIQKILPDVTKRIGRWEVFRPTVYNQKQMLDYDMHYSPISDWSNVKADVIYKLYPELFLFHYFDDLSDYPNQIGWQEIMAQRKEWFCVDATGFSSPFGDGRYYYDWKNLETVQWYVDRLIREREIWSDGIYIDDFWGESYGTLVDFNWSAEASQLLNFRSVYERLSSSANRMQLLANELHRQGKYLTTNFGCARDFNLDGTLVEDTKLLAMPFDGYLLETWLYTWTTNPDVITTEGFDLEFIKNEIDFIKWCGENDKWVVALARSSSELYPARMFSLAGFLMGKHKNAYYCHSDWGSDTYGSNWHEQMQPECFITTGNPLEDYQLNNGLFSRKFDNCVALLNMNEVTQSYILPSGTWYTMRGNNYSGTISVARRQGLVLVKIRP